MFDAGGGVDVRVSYDHRVLDGATAARALCRLEETLNGPIVMELRELAAEEPDRAVSNRPLKRSESNNLRPIRL